MKTARLKMNCITGEFFLDNYVLHNSLKKRIVKVNEKTVVLEYDDKTSRVDKDEVKDSIIRYSVQENDRVFDLSYSNYLIANELNNNDIVQGNTIKIKTRAHVGLSVRINCLETIDRYQLHSQRDRFGRIVKRDGNFFYVELEDKHNKQIKLHRARFILVNNKDSKIFFNIICPKCNDNV